MNRIDEVGDDRLGQAWRILRSSRGDNDLGIANQPGRLEGQQLRITRADTNSVKWINHKISYMKCIARSAKPAFSHRRLRALQVSL